MIGERSPVELPRRRRTAQLGMDERVRADGAVVRCAKSGAGFDVAVFFTEIADADRAAIGELVASRLAGAGAPRA